jgi:Cupin domain
MFQRLPFLLNMPRPARVVHLDELESIPGPGTLTWRPVRLTLGIHAFGCNAYTAASVGEEVVEPHTEAGADHEELYFVASGRATFTIDEQSYDAPAGTYVFVPDPASHRHAVAAVPDTTVLSFGGPPTFKPSAWEWSFRAAALMRTDPERAREILIEGRQEHPEAGALDYDLACLEAVQGRVDAALAALRTAIERRPEVVEWARTDEDLDSLRGTLEFRRLLGTS